MDRLNELKIFYKYCSSLNLKWAGNVIFNFSR